MSRRTALAVACLAALAFPGGALAQSAGDEQYVDPFGDTNQQPPQERAQQNGDSGGSSGQDAPAAQPQPQPQPRPPAEEAAPAQPAQQQGGDTLPRTGLALIPIAAAGYALLLGGIALRRSA